MFRHFRSAARRKLSFMSIYLNRNAGTDRFFYTQDQVTFFIFQLMSSDAANFPTPSTLFSHWISKLLRVGLALLPKTFWLGQRRPTVQKESLYSRAITLGHCRLVCHFLGVVQLQATAIPWYWHHSSHCYSNHISLLFVLNFFFTLVLSASCIALMGLPLLYHIG